jgi:hypothetical protein
MESILNLPLVTKRMHGQQHEYCEGLFLTETLRVGTNGKAHTLKPILIKASKEQFENQ